MIILSQEKLSQGAPAIEGLLEEHCLNHDGLKMIIKDHDVNG
jgi:hypothetical protein